MAYEELRQFLSDLQFPVLGEGNLSVVLDCYFNKMLKDLKDISCNCDYINVFDYEVVEKTTQKLQSLIKKSESNKVKNIDLEFNKLFNSIQWHVFDLGHNFAEFYKIRPIEKKDEENAKTWQWRDLYFLPKRLIKNARECRFSRKGSIALYLSGQLPIAWEECGEPQSFAFSKFSFSKYESFKTLYLRAPSEYSQDICTGEIRESTSIARYMEMLPIIIACTVEYNKSYMKNAYYVSNQLSRWVSKNKKICGITYWTAKSQFYSICGFFGKYNVVIPLKNKEQDYRLDKKINQYMCMTEPKIVSIKEMLHFDKLTVQMVDNARKEYLKYIKREKNGLNYYFFNVVKKIAVDSQKGEHVNSNLITILHMLRMLIWSNVVQIEKCGENCKQLVNVINEICLKQEFFNDYDTNRYISVADVVDEE